MIEILDEPSLFSLVKNPVPFKLQTDDIIITPGTPANRTFNLTGNPAEGETFTIEWNNESVTWIFSNTPDDNNNIIPLNPGVYSGAYVLSVIAEFNANYLISRDFSVTDIGGGSILFVALEVGTAYNITGSTTVVNGDFSDLLNANGVDDIIKPNFKILVEPYKETEWGSGDYERVIRSEYDPDSDLCIVEDSSEVLRNIEPSFPFPVGGDLYEDITIVNTGKVRFYLRYAEKYGNPAVIKKVLASDIKYLLRGGFGYYDFANTSFNDWLFNPLGYKFLSGRPSARLVNISQPEFLYFICGSSAGTLYLKIKIYFTDGTDSGLFGTSPVDFEPYDTLIIPAGYTQLDLGSFNPTKKVSYYELKLATAGNANYSETITYRMVPERMYDKYFIYESSIGGGFDTLCCTGEKSEGVKIEKAEFETIIPYSYSHTDAHLVDSVQSINSVFKIRTGYKSLEEIKRVVDLLVSEYKFEIINDAAGEQKVIPIKISSGSFELYKNSQSQYSLEFQYTYAFSENSFSKLNL